MTSTTQNRLPLLDGLRGLAALFVMLYHIELTFGFVGPFSRGYLFVDFFFLLSGFVLTLSAETRMRSGMSTATFMRARVIRLWPVIAVGTLIGALFYAASKDALEAAEFLVAGLVIVPALWQVGMIFPLNGPQWSLLLELLANIFHGLVLRRLNDAGVLALAVLSAGTLAVTIAHFGSNTLGPFSFNWWFALPRVAFAYTLGVWIGRKFLARPHHPATSWRIAFLLPPAGTLMLPGLPLSVALGDILMVIVAFPALLWLAATSRAPGHARGWLDGLGAISFPLYAIHMPIIDSAATLGKSWPAMLLAIGTATVGAFLLARTLEPKRKADPRVPRPAYSG